MHIALQTVRRWAHDNRGFVLVLLLFGLVRTAVADYNPVPSGSMHPNILEGDVVLVNRLAYNVKIPLTDVVLAHTGEPQRGDIVTFSSPRDGTRLIKRVVGLPGDRIAMRDKQLLLNGRTVAYRPVDVMREDLPDGPPRSALRVHEALGPTGYDIQWLAGLASAPDFGPMEIPPGQYLMLGDNRDNSADSRFIGLVPRKLLIGRAERILVSAAIQENWMPRFDRFGKGLYH